MVESKQKEEGKKAVKSKKLKRKKKSWRRVK